MTNQEFIEKFKIEEYREIDGALYFVPIEVQVRDNIQGQWENDFIFSYNLSAPYPNNCTKDYYTYARLTPEVKTVPWDITDFKCGQTIISKQTTSTYLILGISDETIYTYHSAFPVAEICQQFDLYNTETGAVTELSKQES